MELFFEFVRNHWELWSAFALIIILLLINEWLNKGKGQQKLSPAQAVNLINKENAQVVDLRDMENFRQGHIIGAKHIPREELANKINVLTKFKNTPLILTCAQGQFSTLAATLLRKHEFTQIYILNGGIAAWQNADLPLEKGR